MPDPVEYKVLAVNRGEGKVCVDEGTVLDIAGWHNEDDDYVDPEDATFITFQFPNGCWGHASLKDFDGMTQ